jgi:hypothetical protein
MIENSPEEKVMAKKALQLLTRLRQGYSLDKIVQFIQDQKTFALCTKMLNIPEDYSVATLHSLQLMSKGTI